MSSRMNMLQLLILAKELNIPIEERLTWAQQRFDTQRQEAEKQRQEAEKQRQKAEKQREYEKRKLQKMKKELEGYQSQIDAIQRNIKDRDERIRLRNVMDYFHKARMERIESEDVDDCSHDTEYEENENTKSQYMKESNENVIELQDLNNTKSINEHKNETTETSNEPDYKVSIENIESMTYDSSKSTGTSLPTTCPSLPATCTDLPTSTCPSLPDTICPPLPSICSSPTTNDDFILQDLNKATSASISTTTIICIDNSCYTQDKSHQPEPEVTKETYPQSSSSTDNLSYNQDKSHQLESEADIKESYIQSTSDTSERMKSFQLDFIIDTSIAQSKECESTKENSTMNIESQRILHEHLKLRHFVQGDEVKLILPDLSNKLEVEHFACLATIPEEEISSTPIPEIDISLPASNQIDTSKVITLDDIPLQLLKDIVIFRDHAESFTSIPDTLPILNIDSYSGSSNINREVNSESSNMNIKSNSTSSNIDNTHFHPPFSQRTYFLLKGTYELFKHRCIDRLNSELFSHCSVELSNAEYSSNITPQQLLSDRKLSFGIGQFIFLPNSNAVQSDIICVLNTRWRLQLRKLRDFFNKFRKRTHTTMMAT